MTRLRTLLDLWQLGALYALAIGLALVAAFAVAALVAFGIGYTVGASDRQSFSWAAASAIVWLPLAVGYAAPKVAASWREAHR